MLTDYAERAANLSQDQMDKFQDPEEADYQLIPIAAARRMGILPIAFDSAGRFEPAASERE